MTRDRFAFYAEHYSDIGHLLKLETEVRERYPDELWKALQKTFTDTFSAGTFAGLTGWKCNDESDGPDNWFSLWNPRHYDDERDRGPYFIIDTISKSAERLSSSAIKSSIPCYLRLDVSGGPMRITGKKLVAAAQKRARRLQKDGFDKIDGFKDCFVQTYIGDLLHISTYKSRQKDFGEMTKRVEKLVVACIPIIEAATRA